MKAKYINPFIFASMNLFKEYLGQIRESFMVTSASYQSFARVAETFLILPRFLTSVSQISEILEAPHLAPARLPTSTGQ